MGGGGGGGGGEVGVGVVRAGQHTVVVVPVCSGGERRDWKSGGGGKGEGREHQMFNTSK